MIIDGRKIAEDIVAALVLRMSGKLLSLGVVITEGDVATESFVRIKTRVAERLGVAVVCEMLSTEATTAEAITAIERLARECNGVIVQLPLPVGIDTDTVLRAIPPRVDVDAVNPNNRESKIYSPVAAAIKEIFLQTKINPQGLRVVVVGAGRLVGMPAAALLREMGAEVTVLIEGDSLEPLRAADIVVLGVGKPGMVTPGMLKKGVVLIDAGTSEAGGKLAGDANPSCAEVVSVFTPVPGGVGPITVAMIFKNLFALNTPE